MNNIYHLITEHPARHVVRDLAGKEIFKSREYWLADKLYTVLTGIYQEKQHIGRIGGYFSKGIENADKYLAVTNTHRAIQNAYIQEYQYLTLLRFMGLYSLTPDGSPYNC